MEEVYVFEKGALLSVCSDRCVFKCSRTSIKHALATYPECLSDLSYIM